METRRQIELREMIEGCGAVLHGHFKLASGRHSDTYIEKFRILERPDLLEQVCREIAVHFGPERPDVIAGPSTGGILVAYEVARQLGVPAVYVETDSENKRVLKRGARIEAGACVLLVDDVLTTGVSLSEILPLIHGAEANLIGIGVLIDRSGKTLDFGSELFAASRFKATTYGEDEIPQWLEQVPLSTPGTRASKVKP